MTFKSIPEFPDYEISETGEVRNIETSRIHSTRLNGNYFKITIHNITRYVHVLLMQAHIGPKPSGFVVRHLDGNPLNNSVLNLVYGTYTQNRHDMIKHGTYERKLTFRKVRIIRGLSKCGFTNKRLSELFNVHNSLISKIINGTKWKIKHSF